MAKDNSRPRVPTGPVEVREGYTGSKVPKDAKPPKGPAASVPVKPAKDGKSEQPTSQDKAS